MRQHSQEWLCHQSRQNQGDAEVAAVESHTKRIPKERIAIDEPWSGLGVGIRQHSQEWLCHQSRRNQASAEDREEAGGVSEMAGEKSKSAPLQEAQGCGTQIRLRG